MALAAGLIEAGKIYLGAGAVVAIFFLTVGVGRIDPAASGALSFRLLIAPGVVLLWPVVLGRWLILRRRG